MSKVLPVFPLPQSAQGKFQPPSAKISNQTDTSRVWPRVVGKDAEGKINPNARQEIAFTFLNGTADQKKFVQSLLNLYLPHVPALNLKIDQPKDGIYGKVRIAFTDQERSLSWSYVGIDSLNSIPTPETLRLSGIPERNIPDKLSDIKDPALLLSARVTLHVLGHALGADTTPNLPNASTSYDPWKSTIAGQIVKQVPYGFPEGKESDIGTFLADNNVNLTNGKLGPTMSLLYNDSDPYKPNVDSDTAKWLAAKYSIEVVTLNFNIHKGLDMATLQQDTDLDLYVYDRDGVIFRNNRSSQRTKKRDPNEIVTWSGWIPFADQEYYKNPKTFVILPLTDRTEFYLVGPDNKLWYRQVSPTGDVTNPWEKWKPWDDSVVSAITAVESEGGYDVYFAGKNENLYHFSRQVSHPDMPKGNQIYPISGGANTKAFDNGFQDQRATIYVGQQTPSGFQVSHLERNEGRNTLVKTGPELEATLYDNYADPNLFNFSSGFVGATHHLFAIDKQNQLHHVAKTGSEWPEWDQGFEPKLNKNVISIVTGYSAANDTEDNYLQVFAVTNTGDVYYNAFDRDDVAKKSEWELFDIYPENSIGAFTATTRSGELEVIAIAVDKNSSNPDQKSLYRRSLGVNGWGKWARYEW